MRLALASSALLVVGSSAVQRNRYGSKEKRPKRAHDTYVPEYFRDAYAREAIAASSPPRRTKARKSPDLGATTPESLDVGILSRANGRATFCPGDTFSCDNGLVYGTNTTCSGECDGMCCVGTEACDGFTGMLCKDNVTCNGYRACKSANIGRIVAGCNGQGACYYTAYSGYVGEVLDSCLDYYSCFDAADYSGSIQSIQGSCWGTYACIFAAEYNGIIGEINGSCRNGTGSCSYAAEANGTVGDINSSCFGYQACYYAAGASGTIDYLRSSCAGSLSCANASAYGGDIAGIDGACNAERACRDAGKGGGVPSGIRSCCNGPGDCENVVEETLPSECRPTEPPSKSPTRQPTASPSGRPSFQELSPKSSKGAKRAKAKAKAAKAAEMRDEMVKRVRDHTLSAAEKDVVVLRFESDKERT